MMAGVAAVACALVVQVDGPRPAGAAADTREALRAAREPGPRALVWPLGVEALAVGALDVLCVVPAIGVLHRGGSAAAYLNAAFGAGGVIGSLLLWSAAFAALAASRCAARAPSLGAPALPGSRAAADAVVLALLH